MKKTKLRYFLFASLLVMVTTLVSAVMVACNKQVPQPQTGEEGGVYYYDAGADEYTVVLGEGTQFTLALADTTVAGRYTLDGETLTFTSNKNGENQISAVLKDNVITLNYNSAEYRFLKKINYTVSFDSNDGSAVDSAVVVNGKTVAKPADPSKNGYVFVGWYEDDQFSTPFAFNSHIITANTTVFARWVEKQIGGLEFVVDFDADNGGDNPESKITVGGKLFDLPVVERAGYTFKGWWLSMSGDDRLSYEFSDGMSLDADTTLHAIWQANDLGAKLAEPLVNVSANAVRWNSVAGAREYLLKVQGPDGTYIVNRSLGGTVESVDFDNYPAGDYIVTVTAVATAGDANNSVATRLYKNKALARVSQFSVIDPSVLLFNAVENAEKYYITVDCGDKNHNHIKFDNGQSTHFNFADCMMQKGGIKFTVTASAEGFASSVSKQFVYAPVLDAVTEFEFDELSQKLVWNKVANATGYMVSVKCGNGAHFEEFVNIGSVNSISLKECAKVEGGIVVKVYPVSKSYISPEAATYTFDKKNLATPQNIRIQGTTVSWTAVDGATSYEVRIAGSVVSTNTNSVNLAGKVVLAEKANYALTVVAKGELDSLATDPIDARNLAMADTLKYENSVLSWKHVIGAQSYDVQINDEPIFSVSNGVNFIKVDLTKAGENVLKVRFVSETGSAFEWVTTSVYAHTLTFVSDGGNSVEEQYKAVGDIVVLPTPQKEGYDFLSWYNTPKGPESNGSAYNDSTFSATGDLVLYACYTPKAYTVTYHYGDGGNGLAVSDSVYYQKDYQLIVPQANEATSAFGGWFSAPNGNGVQYTDEKGNSINPWSKIGNADAYAFWFDDVLSFTLTSNAGKPIYAVMQGSRISQVTEVTIPGTYKGVKVGMLSGNAFNGCSNLTVLNIPNTIEVISAVDPFTGCTSLNAINVYEVEGNNSIRYWSSDGVLFDNGRLDQQPADPAQIRSQISYMPLGKTGSYTIPDGIVEIPSLAFENCALTRVVIPSSVTVIGMEAFKGSENLTTVVFDTGSAQALTIADGAFMDCTALEAVSLPARLANIALTKYELLKASGTPSAQEVSTSTGVTNAFVGCKNLTNIYVDKDNKNYKSENGILYNANKTVLLYCLPSVQGEVVIPDSVNTIADGAFIGCNSIKSVKIPSSVTMVGECAFYDTSLKTVTFGGNGFNAVTIGKYAFRGCDDLTSVTFEEGNRVTHIGEGAFYGCDDYNFVKIELPENLTNIGAQAFRDCESLEEVIISSNSSSLEFGSDVFYNCESLKTITLPINVSKLPGVFSGCTSLENVVVDPENPYFTSVDGVLFDKQQTVILFYPQNKTVSRYTLPETVTTISDGVFRGNSYIQRITIGKNVSKIGDGAFMECRNLSSVVFSRGNNGATSLEIGAYAFYDCDDIASFELPARTVKVGEYAFADMGYLSSFTFNEGLQAISDYMFYSDSRLAEVNIPASVKSIGVSAFYRCGYIPDEFSVTFAEDSKLETIGESAFENSYGYDVNVVLPQGLKTIGKRAFYNTKFSGVNIPNTVTTIGVEAFASSKFNTVTFEDGGTEDLIFCEEYVVTYRGTECNGGTFKSCSDLESIELPSRLTYIANEAFDSCYDLANISFGENSRLKHIGDEAFYYTALESLTIPKSVANGNCVIDANGTVEFRIGVGKNAFYSINTLTVVDFEAGGTEPLSIGDGAFNYLNNLETVNFPSRLADYTDANGNTVKGLSERVFASIYSDGTSGGQSSSSKLSAINVAEGGAYYCSKDGVVYSADLTVLVVCPVSKTGKVTVDSHVTKIEDNAFASSKISEIEFEGGTADMVIGIKAFYRCSLIENVVLPDNVVEIMDGAFSYCDSLVEVTLPANLKEFNSNIFTETRIQKINISSGNNGFESKDGIVFSKDMKTLVLYPSTITQQTYEIPEGVTAIAPNAFRKNSYLKTVVLPKGLKEIGEMAFADCFSLTGIVFPNTIESIGQNAFTGCSMLGDVKFEKNGTSLLVIEASAFNNAGITEVELPARLTTIGANAFYRCSVLSKVTFENGSKLESIGDSAFYNCMFLETIALPEGLSIMGSAVFHNCISLVSVTFGEGLREIGDNTFKACSDLESVSFPASLKTIGVGTFTDNSGYSPVYCSSLKSVTFAKGSQLEVIPESTFYNCTSLERFIIPASVTKIGDRLSGEYGWETYHYGAFQGCTNLKSVTFEDGSKCKEIGDSAFIGCVNLEAFTIPSSVARLGASAFEKCESIEEIVIPSTATVYGKNLFNGCSSLVRVTLNEKATALADYMFTNCSSLKQLNIPASVTSFGNGLLSRTAIETFVVPSAVTALPDSFLSDCKSLVSLQLSSGLKSIGRYALSGCTALKSVEIPSGVTNIGENAFENCTALGTVAMPENLESIGRYAFRNCNALTSITVPSKVILIDEYAFSNCYKLVEVINKSSLEIVAKDYDNGQVAYYAEAVLADGDASVITTTEDGFVLFADGDEVKLLGYNGMATNIELPANTTAIYEYAFSGCPIVSVKIPASVVTISAYAFYNCATLTTVVIDGNQTKIGDYAFAECAKLTSISIPDSVESIGEHAFENCVSLENITLPANLTVLGTYAFRYCVKLQSVVIPDGVTKLNTSLFSGCTSLTYVKLPASLSSMGYYVFENCTSFESYDMSGDGNSYYKVVDGALYNGSGTKLISVPCAKTGTFVVPKEVTDIDGDAFKGSNIDMLMFESGRTSKFYLSSAYSGGAWLGKATVKSIVISAENFSYINPYVLNGWTSEQTIYFTESAEELENLSIFYNWGSYVKANVVFEYEIPQAGEPQ